MDIAHTFPVHVAVDGPRPSSDLPRSLSYKTGFRLSNEPNFLELGCSSWTQILIGPDPVLNLTFIRGPIPVFVLDWTQIWALKSL